jgi:hypothetical protein
MSLFMFFFKEEINLSIKKCMYNIYASKIPRWIPKMTFLVGGIGGSEEETEYTAVFIFKSSILLEIFSLNVSVLSLKKKESSF